MGACVGGKCSTRHSSSRAPQSLVGVLCKGRGGGEEGGSGYDCSVPLFPLQPSSLRKRQMELAFTAPKAQSTPVPPASTAAGPPDHPSRCWSPSPAPRSTAGLVHDLSQTSRGNSSRQLRRGSSPSRRSQPCCPQLGTILGCPRCCTDILSSLLAGSPRARGGKKRERKK